MFTILSRLVHPISTKVLAKYSRRAFSADPSLREFIREMKVDLALAQRSEDRLIKSQEQIRTDLKKSQESFDRDIRKELDRLETLMRRQHQESRSNLEREFEMNNYKVIIGAIIFVYIVTGWTIMYRNRETV
jgi:predicted nuclease with TOPRIM domain